MDLLTIYIYIYCWIGSWSIPSHHMSCHFVSSHIVVIMNIETISCLCHRYYPWWLQMTVSSREGTDHAPIPQYIYILLDRSWSIPNLLITPYLSPRSSWLCQRWKYLFSDGGMMESLKNVEAQWLQTRAMDLSGGLAWTRYRIKREAESSAEADPLFKWYGYPG